MNYLSQTFIERNLHNFNISKLREKPDYIKFYFVVSLIGSIYPELKLNIEQIEYRRKIWRILNINLWNIALIRFNKSDDSWQEKTKEYYNKISQRFLTELDNLVDLDFRNIISPYLSILDEEKEKIIQDEIGTKNTDLIIGKFI